MLELTLAPHSEALADPTAADYPRLQGALNGPDTGPNGRRMLLYHQWRTYQALRQAEITVNSYNTGTGKTQAALLHLLDLDAAYQKHRVRERASVLFIAPTNELLRQHEGDIRTFITNNHLAHRVLRLDAARIGRLADETQGRAFKRRGDSLQKMLDDPGSVLKDENGRYSEDLFPYVLVTNPDIFYYALYVLGNEHDRRVLFRSFVSNFQYVVVDEFHYYNAKQFANFLFFFTLLREWGYFAERGRRVCLLTATPNPKVSQYLAGLGVGEKAITTAYVQPGDEPAGLPQIPALAPVRLRLYSAEETADGLVDLARTTKSTVADWLVEGRHGAVVSSALWRINRIFDDYRHLAGSSHIARLTGAEREENRAAARTANLLLATPTVDIGYNFDRPGKTRQSIDFLLYDARYADEFIQRLGRAGRVLGKAVADTPSDVWALVPDELISALRDSANTTLRRSELAEMVAATMPARNGMYGYVGKAALNEAALPIYHYKQALPRAEQEQAELLFQAVKEVYSAPAHWTFAGMEGRIRRYLKLREIVPRVKEEAAASEAGAFCVGSASVQARKLIADREYEPLDETATAAELERFGKGNSRNKLKFNKLREEDIETYHIMEAGFNFRDSFDPPPALIHDPRHLLANADYTLYSALHLAQNYQAEWSDNPHRIAEWQDQAGLGDVDVSLACTLSAPRDPRLVLRLSLDRNETQRDWEERYLHKVSACRGFYLIPAQDSGGKVPGELNEVFARQYFAFYAVPNSGPEVRALLSLKRTSALYTNTLIVNFDEGGTKEYLIVLGTAALMVAAERNLQAAAHIAQREAAAGRAIIV